jgi:Holliday junction DNA helicase RuvA
VALNVLSALSPRDLERALALSDKAAIGRAQGVGPKLALRIVTELKDKAPAMMLRGHGDETVAHAAPRGPEADAVAALIGLGYSPAQASETVARVAHESGAQPVEALIRESLRRLGVRG